MSTTLPAFDEESKNFQLWWTRFKAYAAVKSSLIKPLRELLNPACQLLRQQTQTQRLTNMQHWSATFLQVQI
jgi:hypothetical protein